MDGMARSAEVQEIEDAQEALTRIMTTDRERWDDWVRVGRGLLKCRTLALRRAQANDFNSHAAKLAMGEVLAEKGLDRADKGVRSDLLKLMDALPDVVAWRSTLSEEQQVAWNNPRVVYRHWRKFAAAGARANANDDEPTTTPSAKRRNTLAELGAALAELAELRAEIETLREQLDAERAKVASLEAQLQPALAEPEAEETEPTPAATELEPVRTPCVHCGTVITQASKGRPKMYCSKECLKAAAAERRAA